MKRYFRNIFFVWIAFSVFKFSTAAQERDYNETIKERWTAADTNKVRIKNFDSPDGKLSLFEFYPGDTTFSVTVLASADGSVFHGLLPLPPPNMVDDPGAKTSFAKVVRIKWSPDSKHLAVEDTLSKHSKFALFKVTDGLIQNITPKDFRNTALAAARIDESKLKSSGQMPDTWTAPNTLRVISRFTSSGTPILIPMEVVIDGETATTRKATMSPKKVK